MVEGKSLGYESLKNETAGHGLERDVDMAYGWLAREEGRSSLSKVGERQTCLVNIDD